MLRRLNELHPSKEDRDTDVSKWPSTEQQSSIARLLLVRLKNPVGLDVRQPVRLYQVYLAPGEEEKPQREVQSIV
jgi:hypothetical protein